MAMQPGMVRGLKNMRYDPLYKGDLVSIMGEQQTHTLSNSGYICVGAIYKFGYVIALWYASPTLKTITVNGTVVASSANIPISGNKLSVDLYKDTKIFLSFCHIDNLPQLLDVQDMLDNVATDKYFSGYNADSFGPVTEQSVTIPMFDGLVDSGGAGLKVGSYAYAVRFVDSDGNKTVTGPFTPYINVPIQWDEVSSGAFSADGNGGVRKGFKTIGGAPGDTSSYGVRIRIRANAVGFSYMEVVRLSNFTGTPRDYQPQLEYVKVAFDANGVAVNLDNLTTVSFVDTSNQVWLTDTVQISDRQASISGASQTLFYEGRLLYYGIKYKTTDLGLSFIVGTVGGKKIIPCLQSLGRIGHKSIFNQAYYKSEIPGEESGIAIVFYDGAGNKTEPFLIEPTYRNPNNREAMTSYPGSKDFSSAVNTYNATVMSGDGSATLDDTFEMFANDGLAKGTTPQSSMISYCADTVPYNPLTPTKKANKLDGLSIRINGWVSPTDPSSALVLPGDRAEYNPKLFSQTQHSLGMAIPSIDTSSLPPWVKAFSVVKTKDYMRVVAQGMVMYAFQPPSDLINDVPTKAANKVWFYSPDVDPAAGISGVLADIVNNPTRYSLQLVSSLGFASEVYSGNTQSADAGDGSVDAGKGFIQMATYTNINKEDGNINPTFNTGNVGHSGYVGFSKYRNSNYQTKDVSSSKEAMKYKVIDAVLNPYPSTYGLDSSMHGRGVVVEITLDNPVYKTTANPGTLNTEAAATKNFHEPFYLANLLLEGVGTSGNNIRQYRDFGHFQKLSSIIGYGAGENQAIQLVDERVEDCIVGDTSAKDTATPGRYLYVGGKAWKDASKLSGTDLTTLLASLLSAGTSGVSDGYKTIYGVYFTVGSVVSFGYDTSPQYLPYILPNVGDAIEVRYDSRLPLRVFGGEGYVGTASFAAIDGKYWHDASSGYTDADVTGSNQLRRVCMRFNTSFPYSSYFSQSAKDRWTNIENNTFHLLTKQIFSKDDAALGLTCFRYTLNRIFQWIMVYPSVTRVNVPLIYSNSFPNRNYVPRLRYASGKYDVAKPEEFLTNNGMSYSYFLDYGDEPLNWDRGGFHFVHSHNLDYAKIKQPSITSLPVVGFTRVTDFPNRVIYSSKRNPSVQDSPNLRTFLASSVYDLKGGYGAGARIGSISSPGGNVVVVVAEEGICFLVSGAIMLQNLDTSQLALIKSDIGFIQQEMWVKGVGMLPVHRELACETPMGFVFLDKTGRLRLVSGVGAAEDISFGGMNILTTIMNKYTSSMRGMFAYYSSDFDEVVMAGDNGSTKVVLSYSLWAKTSQGLRDYVFDHMVGAKDKTQTSHGFRQGLSFSMENGVTLNGSAIQTEATFIANPDGDVDKEFAWFRISGGDPTELRFASEEGDTDTAVVYNADLNLYGKSWEQYIPRKLGGSRYRVQGNYLEAKVLKTLIEKFKITMLTIGYAKIK